MEKLTLEAFDNNVLCDVLARIPLPSHGSVAAASLRLCQVIKSHSFRVTRRSSGWNETCIVVVGGVERNYGRPLDTCWACVDLKWFKIPSLPVAQAGACTACLRSKDAYDVYLLGGFRRPCGGLVDQLIVVDEDDCPEVVDSVLKFDMTTWTWEYVEAMHCERKYATCGVLDGKIVIAGGHRNGIVASVEAYDPLTNTWSILEPMPDPVFGAASGVIGNRLYVVGGFSTEVSDQLRVYDARTQSWTLEEPLPGPRDSAAGVVHNGSLYIIGGCNEDEVPVSTVFRFDPLEKKWSDEGPLPASRFGCQAISHQGRIVLIGGGEPWEYDGLRSWSPCLNSYNFEDGSPVWHLLAESGIVTLPLW